MNTIIKEINSAIDKLDADIKHLKNQSDAQNQAEYNRKASM